MSAIICNVRSSTLVLTSFFHTLTLASKEQKARAFLEQLNITLYLWTIGCALYPQPILARINGNNELQQTTPLLDPSLKTTDPTPFMRNTANMSRTEIYWGTLMWLSHRLEFYNVPKTWIPVKRAPGGGFMAAADPTPFEAAALVALSQPQPIRALERHLSSLSAFTYGVLAQHWMTAVSQSNTFALQSWSPVWKTVAGSRTILRAALHVNGVQLLFSGIGALALTMAVFLSINRSPSRNATIRDGGVLDMICLLHNSSLPTIIGGRSHELSITRRRKVAESTTMESVPIRLL